MTIVVYGILLIAFGALSLSMYIISQSEESQLAAQRWTYGVSNLLEEDVTPLRYTQLSAFLYEGVFNQDSVMQLRSQMDNALTQASISKQSDASRLWLDAYSIEKSIRVEKSSAEVTVMGVGGDFFTFHKLPLLAGTYFDSGSNLLDIVIIDEVLAWQIFGSYNVVGFDIFVSGSPYTITGVVSREYTDFANETYGENPRMYMPYETLNIMNNYNLSITCYEALMPNPVSNFAMNMLKDNMSVSDSNVVYRENTSRFNILSLYSSLANYSQRSMSRTNVIFPYWENIAVVKTDTCTVLLLFNTFVLACLLIFTIYQIVYIKLRYEITFKNLFGKAEKGYEQVKYKRKLR